MNNRTQLLSAIEKWKAIKSNPASAPDSKEWQDAHAAYESALHEAGVYKEALRGQRILNEEVRKHKEEPERTFYHWAYCYAEHKPEILKALHKTQSYVGRSVILDGIQAALAQAGRKKEEARKADCLRRTAALIEEEQKRLELLRAEKEREEQHKAELAARAIARALPKPAEGDSQAKVRKNKLPKIR